MSKQYTIYAKVTGIKYLGEVDAETLKDAEEKAAASFGDEMYINLCHQCSHEFEDDPVENFVIYCEETGENLDFDGNYIIPNK